MIQLLLTVVYFNYKGEPIKGAIFSILVQEDIFEEALQLGIEKAVWAHYTDRNSFAAFEIISIKALNKILYPGQPEYSYYHQISFCKLTIKINYDEDFYDVTIKFIGRDPNGSEIRFEET